MENEITVLANIDYNNLDKILKEKGFKIVDEYTIDDIYMISNDIDLLKLNKLEILSKCVLIRNISPNYKYLTYKYKVYDEFENIIEQHKYDCPIEDTNKAIKFMEAINYKKLFNLFDKLIVYANDKIELAIQLVDNHIYLEVEDDCKNIGVKYDSVDSMIKELDSYNLPYNKDNYFVKKAEIKLMEIMK